ncbi:MAG: chemotaxis protein CheW [Calditerrivibrio sp.]|nr:chemotaxis protein CheW [Calditerrivibrio sp.]
MIKEILIKKSKGEPIFQPKKPFMKFLRFRVGNEFFLVDLPLVVEVCEPKEFYPVPGGSIFLLGLMSLRNIIITVYDIRMIFGIKTVWKSQKSSVIVLSFKDETLGLYVDEVIDIISVFDEGDIIENKDSICTYSIYYEDVKCNIIDLENIINSYKE